MTNSDVADEASVGPRMKSDQQDREAEGRQAASNGLVLEQKSLQKRSPDEYSARNQLWPEENAQLTGAWDLVQDEVRTDGRCKNKLSPVCSPVTGRIP